MTDSVESKDTKFCVNSNVYITFRNNKRLIGWANADHVPTETLTYAINDRDDLAAAMLGSEDAGSDDVSKKFLMLDEGDGLVGYLNLKFPSSIKALGKLDLIYEPRK